MASPMDFCQVKKLLKKPDLSEKEQEELENLPNEIFSHFAEEGTGRDREDYNLLFHCVKNAQISHSALQTVIKKSNVDWQNSAGTTALHLAVQDSTQNSSVERVRELLEAQAKPCLSKHKDGWSPLHSAVTKRNPEMVKLLLTHLPYQANVNAKVKTTGWTPLHAAVMLKHKRIISLLLEYGGDVHAKASKRDIKNGEKLTPSELAKEIGFQRGEGDSFEDLVKEMDEKRGGLAKEAFEKRLKEEDSPQEDVIDQTAHAYSDNYSPDGSSRKDRETKISSWKQRYKGQKEVREALNSIVLTQQQPRARKPNSQRERKEQMAKKKIQASDLFEEPITDIEDKKKFQNIYQKTDLQEDHIDFTELNMQNRNNEGPIAIEATQAIQSQHRVKVDVESTVKTKKFEGDKGRNWDGNDREAIQTNQIEERVKAQVEAILKAGMFNDFKENNCNTSHKEISIEEDNLMETNDVVPLRSQKDSTREAGIEARVAAKIEAIVKSKDFQNKIDAMIAAKTEVPNVNSKTEGSLQKCGPCQDNDNLATNYCPSCEDYFCSECTRQHGRFNATKGHTISSTKRVLCTICKEEQKDKDAKTNCRECQQNFCTECTREHGKFKSNMAHRLRDLTLLASTPAAVSTPLQHLEPTYFEASESPLTPTPEPATRPNSDLAELTNSLHAASTDRDITNKDTESESINLDQELNEDDGIKEFLEGLNLGHYTNLFHEQDIELDILPTITEEELRGIGVKTLGQRKKIINAAKEL